MKEHAISPKELLAPLKKDKHLLKIGVPKENAEEESRVALAPEAVKVLCQAGLKICIETGAGEGSHFSDHSYSEAGAEILPDSQSIFQCPFIIKVEPPTPQEIERCQPETFIVSALQFSQLTREYLALLQKKKIIALAYELFQDKVGEMPFIRAMSEIAGSSALFIASECMNSHKGGKGVLLGGITGVLPASIVILGAGTVAEYATRVALGLGAKVQIFDNNLYKLRRLKHLVGHAIPTSTLDSLALSKALQDADVAIGAIRMDNQRNRFMVSEEMVSQMQPGSVILDINIDQGGCFETSRLTSHKNPTFEKYGIIHYGIPNIPSRMGRTASRAISNIYTTMMLQIQDCGGLEEMIYTNKGFLKGIYTYKGCITNKQLASRFELKYKDLELLMAARM